MNEHNLKVVVGQLVLMLERANAGNIDGRLVLEYLHESNNPNIGAFAIGIEKTT